MLRELRFALAVLIVAFSCRLAPAQGVKEGVRFADPNSADPEQVIRAEVSADGKTLAVAFRGDGEWPIRVWDLKTKAVIGEIDLGRSNWALGSGGKLIAAETSTLGGNSVLTVARLVGNEYVQQDVLSYEGRALNLLVSGDGRRVATLPQWEKKIRVFDIESRKMFNVEVRSSSHLQATCCSRDLRTLAVPAYQDVDLYDVESGIQRNALLDHRGRVCCMAFGPDGKTLAVASYVNDVLGANFKTHVKIWDIVSGKEILASPEAPGRVESLSFTTDGNHLLVTFGHSQGTNKFRYFDRRSKRWTDAVALPGGPADVVASSAGIHIVRVPDVGLQVWRLSPER